MKISQKSIGWALILSSAILLLLTSLGQWFGAGSYKSNPPRSWAPDHWERFDPALVKKTPDLDSLYRAAEARAPGPLNTLPPKEAMKFLYETTADRFTHASTADHNIFSNWILAAMRILHPEFAQIGDADALLRNGYSAYCSQVSFILLKLAEKAGIRPRHVGLSGHVVMEAWYDDDWHLYDPDLEIAPEDENGSIFSVDDLSRDINLALAAYAERGVESYVKEIAGVIASREDNTFMSYPVGSHFIWKKQVVALLEKAAEVLKFVIPILTALVGIAILSKSLRRTV
ncbi:MAG: hypothetical protein NPINA01_33300 [Nitrospinaceae bacterium]|nr:MAG: hypothetical protein NPINA01_33300 [Nitrospinaceae bacterium]